MSLFSFSEIEKKNENDSNGKISKDAVLINKYENLHTLKIKNIKELVGEQIAENDIYFLWTQNSFNAFTFILWAIKHFGTIEELLLTTYAINEKVVEMIVRWLDKGLIKSVTIFVSDTLKVRNAKINDQLQILAQTRNITIFYAWNHSKITLIKTADKFLCIEGSGNLSENSRFENYILTNNKKLYDFRKNCILDNAD
ncbi:MAG: hypothetical protein LBS50_06945 [Prevotellaceae bacterium]|jgi:hypothetical protein|nr:hypothetical protein [Prevotellaceae bacterium]